MALNSNLEPKKSSLRYLSLSPKSSPYRPCLQGQVFSAARPEGLKTGPDKGFYRSFSQSVFQGIECSSQPLHPHPAYQTVQG